MTLLRAAAWTCGAPFRLALMGLIRAYRPTLGGMLGGQCRFHPSCSHYAEDAIRRRGALRGLGLAGWRILRCGPFTRGGVDPAPARAAVGKVAYDAVIHPARGASS